MYVALAFAILCAAFLAGVPLAGLLGAWLARR